MVGRLDANLIEEAYRFFGTASQPEPLRRLDLLGRRDGPRPDPLDGPSRLGSVKLLADFGDGFKDASGATHEGADLGSHVRFQRDHHVGYLDPVGVW